MRLIICLNRIQLSQTDPIWDFSQRDIYDILMDHNDGKMDRFFKVTVLFEDLNRLAFKSTKRNGYFLDTDFLTNTMFDKARSERFWEPLQERAIARLMQTNKYEFFTTNALYKSHKNIGVVANYDSV